MMVTRSCPSCVVYWRDRLTRMRAMGLNAVQTCMLSVFCGFPTIIIEIILKEQELFCMSRPHVILATCLAMFEALKRMVSQVCTLWFEFAYTRSSLLRHAQVQTQCCCCAVLCAIMHQ